jgi:insertion element IS1 protein InsB
VFFGKTYQVDELFTYIGNKKNKVCIAYSLEAETGEVIDIVVGRRNKTNLNKIISTLVLSNAVKITTDKLNIYRELIPRDIHSTKFRGTNAIERRNLDLRTHLKRLNRKTICYSKSLAVLTAIVKIYFWYERE